MELLGRANSRWVHATTSLPNDEFLDYLRELGLLRKRDAAYFCQRCSSLLCRYEMKGRASQYACKKCSTRTSEFVGTFFENARLTPQQIFEISYWWSTGMVKYEHLQREVLPSAQNTFLSRQSICDWLNFCRDVCTTTFLKLESQEGMLEGPGKVVEIDETCLSRRKHNTGRVTMQTWIFGMVERGTTKMQMELCPIHPETKKSLRTAAALLPIIQRHCRPGTTIISDKWSAYGGIEKLPEGYQHFTVNHSQNFVDPSTGAHTQTMESSWQKLKAKHKERYGTHRHMLSSYLDEHIWRKKFGNDPFYHFWKCVSKIYDLNVFGGPDVKE